VYKYCVLLLQIAERDDKHQNQDDKTNSYFHTNHSSSHSWFTGMQKHCQDCTVVNLRLIWIVHYISLTLQIYITV